MVKQSTTWVDRMGGSTVCDILDQASDMVLPMGAPPRVLSHIPHAEREGDGAGRRGEAAELVGPEPRGVGLPFQKNLDGGAMDAGNHPLGLGGGRLGAQGRFGPGLSGWGGLRGGGTAVRAGKAESDAVCP